MLAYKRYNRKRGVADDNEQRLKWWVLWLWLGMLQPTGLARGLLPRQVPFFFGRLAQLV